MTTATTTPPTLPVLPAPPASWKPLVKNTDDADSDAPYFAYSIKSKPCSKCEILPIYPVGKGFFALYRRKVNSRSMAEDEDMERALNDAQDDDANGDEDEEESPELLRSDPLRYKQLDLYAVMGLSRLRYKATDDDIKRAYRRKVLKHHPDKLKSKSSAASKASGKPLSKKEEDSFFKCIQRAWEILSDPIKRRQFDSCDPSFDEKTPSTLPKSANFYKTFGAAFERNSHFSKVQPVPSLGDENTPREQVEGFYNFWFNFDSWRTFEWEDEEDKESAESREDKRWLEKKNKAQRAKRKQEDNRRISTMVESAMKFDPRLAKFKEEDRYAKDAKKREREEAERKKKEDAQRKLEEEAETKAREEAEAKAREDEERKGRKAAKEAQRKGRKAVKRLLEEQNYFLPPTANATEIYAQVTKMEAIFEAIGTSIADLELFKQELTNAKSRDAKLSVFTNRCNNPCSAAPVPVEEPKQEPEPVATPVAAPTPKPTAVKWTPKDLQLLTKSIKLFPGGTVERWEKIADYLSHHTNTPRTSAECIKISKQIQSGAIDPALLAQAFVEQENLAIKSRNVTIADPPTVRTDDDEPKSAEPKEDEEASEWSPVQQAQLEAALKEFPAGMFKENPADRWDKIAACVEGKSKKEVKLRMKELADLIKKKKQQA